VNILARPSKNVNLLSKHLTKEEKQNRQEQEDKLKGRADNIVPAQELNDNQIYLFNYIKSELSESGLLTNLDIFILTNCAIAIDRLQWIEDQINKKPALLLNDNLMRRKKDYGSDFYRCCNELSLSPQSRAKIANINIAAKKEKEDPLLKALREDDDE
jgi:P27 family predicted phage terminase small subunit